MNKIILLTRPEHDTATSYISYYAGLTIKQARDHSIACKDFHGKEVIVQEVHKFIIKQQPKLLFLNGHGSPEEIEGNKGDILFSIKDKQLLKDKIIYARSCNLGAKFGKEIVDNGSFIGYKVPFVFYTDTIQGNPAKDKVANAIIEPTNEIINSLLKGNTAVVAHERSKASMRKNMNRLLSEGAPMILIEALWNNHEGQVIYGDEKITF